MVYLYVDDLICTDNSTSTYDEFKRSLMCEFEMSNMGLLQFFLRLEVRQQEDGILISQKKYTNNTLKRFKLKGATPLCTPMEVDLKLSKSKN